MQIDSRSFNDHIDLVLQDIESAHFISFDCEFTGLVTQLQHIEGLFPDYKQFYERIKETAINFNLLQLGITTYKFEGGEYFPHSYNFYVSGSNRIGFNKVILAEWDSMAFLARNGMDFSQAFLYGIQFKRLKQVQQVGGTINPLAQKPNNEEIFYSLTDRASIQQIQKQFKAKQRLRVNFKSKRVFDYFKNKYDISFDKPNKNMERYQYDVKIYNKDQIIFSQQKDQKKEVMTEKIEEVNLQAKILHFKRTLQVVIEKIIQCKKPLVGHFPNLDIGLIYHSFIDELPETFQQFTYQINQLFPFIYDTKVISRRLQNRMKSIKVDLKSLYKACFNPKLLKPYANINYKHVEAYVLSDSSHEAGYDSFMTGCAFIAMLNYLYDVKQAPFVFANANEENKVLYSKFSGEISLVGPEFSQKTALYLRRMVIFAGAKVDHNFKELGNKLSLRGTLSVHQDNGETYYFFDDNQDIQEILKQFNHLKAYDKRSINKSRHVFP